MQIDIEELENLIEELSTYTPGCCSASAFIGVYKGMPIRVQVMTLKEAEESENFNIQDLSVLIIKD